jgi:chromosome segregation ATPase
VNSNTITSTNPPKRVRIESDDWIDKAPRSRLLERWKEQDLYIDYLESRLNKLQQSIESNERLREKEAECRKLKSTLNYRFLTKTTQQQSFVNK